MTPFATPSITPSTRARQDAETRLAFRLGIETMQSHVNREDRKVIALRLQVRALELEVDRLTKAALPRISSPSMTAPANPMMME